MKFSSLGLSPDILRAIDDAGYTTPTSIQSQAIPLILKGIDLIGCSQTGSGKTAAFVLPILQHLTSNAIKQSSRTLRALIVSPTRELAVQIQEFIREYGSHTGLRSTALYGGVDIKPQLQDLRRGVDIVVATPGRLLDHIERKSINLGAISFLVLDEADRMLDMGFIKDIRRIIRSVPRERQTLLFSATMPDEIRQLAETTMKNPQRVEVGSQQELVPTIAHHVFPVRQDRKLDLLYHMLTRESMGSVLVFSRTKHGADKIAKRLERHGIQTAALHSNRTQNQRQRALEGFKRGHFRVLVATDIAARGIDIDGISHVINFDVPTYAEDYVHRTGRTGRAGASGDAFTFVSMQEEPYLRRIERFMGRRLPKAHYPDFDNAATASALVPPAPAPEAAAPVRKQRERTGDRPGKSRKQDSGPIWQILAGQEKEPPLGSRILFTSVHASTERPRPGRPNAVK
jgi:ATP-dependent RNA helicase RhlE